MLLSGKTRADERLAADVHYLLRELSFEVFRGDRIALVGASGAGKTSLLRLLNRLSEPTGGVIYLDNQPLPQIPAVALRQQVALVLQESKLLGMTVQQALAYPLTLRHLDKRAIQDRIQKWSDRLHLPSDWLERTELQLSVGQRQWVAIVRALVAEPKVLLLDEPTASLDMGRSDLLLKVLSDVAQVDGTTVIMANHQLELAEQWCDRVLHLEQGQLRQDLTAQQLDWQALKQTLVAAETQQSEEWD
ncbi:cobalt ABC transporter [Stenomitos frigidus ULC18]|uniref:Cobalt ABC transporter n=2 Tax=Stenomitos TaxID=1844270 RepID=A0A2T1DVJ5_9CYAN|nr:cobalt ABC transporter [Stenomitos frigidus ULC18]